MSIMLWNLLLDLQTLLLCYYEFYSRLQTTVQFSLYCDIFLEFVIVKLINVTVQVVTVQPFQFWNIFSLIAGHILFDFEIYCNVWT
jgi:hypothetical protein